MTDFERTAYRNEIDLLQRQVERYKEQNRQLIRFIFKLRKKPHAARHGVLQEKRYSRRSAILLQAVPK